MQVVKREHIRYAFMSVGQEKPRPAAAAHVRGGGRDSARFAGRRSTRGTPRGRLDIAWKGPGHPLYMTGPGYMSTTDLFIYEATRGRTAGTLTELDDRAVVDYLIKNPEFLSAMRAQLKRYVCRIRYVARFVGRVAHGPRA